MSVHQPHPPVGPAGPAAAPRKRRRRALATGAAEDCFTCRINGTKCDRRRPYCGPCLDIGNECTGYRTQLTWGVGVASRGKLRGMTLPVPIESNISVTERDRRCAVKEKSVSKTALRAQRSRIAPEASNHPSSNGDIEERSITTNYDFVNMEHPSATSAINSAVAKHDFPQTSKSPTFTEPNATSMVNTSLMMQSSYPPPPQHPQRNLEYPSAVLNYHKPSYSRDSMNSNSPGVMASSTLSEYDSTYTPHSGSPYSLSPSPSDSSIYDGSLMVSSAYLPPSSLSLTSSMPSYAPLVTSTHLASQFMDGHNVPQHRNYHWGHMGLNQQEVSAVEGNLPDLLCDDEMLAHPDPEFASTLAPYLASMSAVVPPHPEQYQRGYSVAAPQMSVVVQISMELPSPPQLTHLAPKLRFLIDYYDKTVYPPIAAFGGPSNPY